jgi:hypothetical protein
VDDAVSQIQTVNAIERNDLLATICNYRSCHSVTLFLNMNYEYRAVRQRGTERTRLTASLQQVYDPRLPDDASRPLEMVYISRDLEVNVG